MVAAWGGPQWGIGKGRFAQGTTEWEAQQSGANVVDMGFNGMSGRATCPTACPCREEGASASCRENERYDRAPR
jgi:hypothetical protein